MNPIRIVAMVLLLLSCNIARSADPCIAPEYRQFDFWIGEWQVRTPDGKIAGINRIERQHGGCALRERYATGRGYSGESLNIYDATRKVWHQTWVDSAGLLLVLEGGRDGDSMMLEGQRTTADGTVERHRIRWTPEADGSVRQHWQTAGAEDEWRTVFDGRYTRE
jgi:hypothetical protein